MARICVDTCFLIGLYDQNDQYHKQAVRQFASIFGESSANNTLVAPWPILYESCGSKQAKDSGKTIRLHAHWSYLHRLGRLVLLDDHPFREEKLEEHLVEDKRPLSLVDRVLRSMILNPNRLFEAFLTYNARDFADACRSGGVMLIDEKVSPQSYCL